MPSPMDIFLSRFGSRPLGTYNPFGGPAPQPVGPAYTPGPFTMPQPGGPQAPQAPQVPGMSGLDPSQPVGNMHGGGGVGGQSSTDQGGAFGRGETTRTDRQGGVINRAQNQEPTLGNIARAGLMGLGTVTANPIGLANTIGGIAMNPNNPPLGGALGSLLGSGEQTTAFADNGSGNPQTNADAGFSSAGAGLLSGGVTTPSTPGMAVPSTPGGLLSYGAAGPVRGGDGGPGNTAADKAQSAASERRSAALGNPHVRGGSARKGAGSSSSGGNSHGGGGKSGRSGGGSGAGRGRGASKPGGDNRGNRRK